MTRAHLKTPRAAAVAGIVFSVLLIISLVLIRISIPADPQDAGTWLPGGSKTVNLALNLFPFAGIAFLWFIGVLRDRMGAYEDRFFATVFLGSGLLAMLFTSSAVAGGILRVYGATPGKVMESGIYAFGRAVTYQIMNAYAIALAVCLGLAAAASYLGLAAIIGAFLAGMVATDEPLVGNGDIQSLADLSNSFAMIRTMRIAPVTKEAILRLGAATVAPVAPLALTMMPLEELLKRLIGLVF